LTGIKLATIRATGVDRTWLSFDDSLGIACTLTGELRVWNASTGSLESTQDLLESVRDSSSPPQDSKKQKAAIIALGNASHLVAVFVSSRLYIVDYGSGLDISDLG
jgi:WD40 repeat protein